MNRMLKTALWHPAHLKRAKTRSFPTFVLGSEKSSTYPAERASLGWLRAGWVKYWYACGLSSPAALLDDCFEHPEEEMVLA